MRQRILSGCCSVFFLLCLSVSAYAALSTDELIRLKAAGLSEPTIKLMVESGYVNTSRVLRLKEAGFADDTIASIIRSDRTEERTAGGATLSKSLVAEIPLDTARITTAAHKLKIEHYLIYRNNPVLQSSTEQDSATISGVGGRTLKVEWPERAPDMLGLIRENFKSPFYWDLTESDTLTRGATSNLFVLQSTTSHPARPATDKAHYWVLSFEMADAEFAKWIELARGRTLE